MKSIITILFAFLLFRASAGDLALMVNKAEFIPVVIPEDSLNHTDRKVITSVLAFPFPFGLVGAHRVFLGTKPYIPIIYIATLGGCFGILPLIDFVVILTKKDLSSYEGSGKVFMWLK